MVTLPNRRATHWTMRSIYNAAVDLLPYREQVDIGVSTEVPRDAQGLEVQRKGNRYYPSTVDVDGPDFDLRLFPEAARALARALLIAADVCEAEDIADADQCGHWAPCDCQGKA